jgi:hypothetical protein
MISKTELTELGLLNIEDYRDYIVDSYINGQHKQAKELYLNLSVPQRYDFGDFLISNDICNILERTPLELIYFLER